MTPSELKYKIKVHEHEPFFFTPKTMKFFGDTMKNYGVRSATIDIYSEKNVGCWELYRRRPVKHGLSDSAYFSKQTFERKFKAR